MIEQRASVQSHKPSPSWFELFYDLIIVAIVAQSAKVFLSQPSWTMTGLILTALLTLFTVWLFVTLSHSAVPINDPTRRMILLVQMILLAVAALALGPAGLPSWVGFASMAGAALSLTWIFARNANQAPALRRPLMMIAISSGAGAGVFAASVLPSLALEGHFGVVLASVLTLFGCLVTLLPVIGPTLRDLLQANALDLPHLEERCALFVIIVLGESFVGLLISLGRIGTIPNPAVFVLTFIVAFAVWSVYFNSVLPSRMPMTAAGLRGWILGHALLVLSMVAFAVQFTDLVLGRDSSPEPTYSGHWTPTPLLGIAVALASLALMARGVARSLQVVQIATCAILGLCVIADFALPPIEISMTGNLFITVGALALITDAVACGILRTRAERVVSVVAVNQG